jgi:hypothetical protein
MNFGVTPSYNFPENGTFSLTFPKVNGESMVEDASNTWVTPVFEGDIALWTDTLSITKE